jgi:hypothetical protein
MSLPTPTITMDPAIMKEMDGPLVELAQRSGGDLRKLLYAFFSFLHRRTDFYCVPHDDDSGKGHRLGFSEGDAEKLLLAAFRQFPLRKMPKQTGPRADPPGEVSPSSASSKTAVAAGKTTASSTKKDTATAKETKTQKEIRKAANEDPMESTRFTDEGKQVPVGNGGATSKFRWTQTIEEVTLLVAPPERTRGKDLAVSIKRANISVKMKKAVDGEDEPRTILEGKLPDTIQPDESTWSIEGGVMLLVLQKSRKTWWESALVGDPKIDTTLVDSRRRIDEYDDSTQGAIRRILFDQRQYRLGKPTSDQIMRQQGINPIPSLPKGVEYIDKETLDNAEKRSEA